MRPKSRCWPRRSGTPAWGPEILARHHMLDNIAELPDLYADWERWAAAVSESHSNYPALIWFRSPVSTRSWLLSLVAMMDSAALYHSVSPTETPRQARLCLSMGTNCLRSMAGALQIPFDADPIPTAGTRLTEGGVHRRLRPAGRGAIPHGARPGRRLAPFPGVAGQLRVDRRRPDQVGDAAAGARGSCPVPGWGRPSGPRCAIARRTTPKARGPSGRPTGFKTPQIRDPSHARPAGPA